MGPLCFGAADVSSTSVNIYGFVLRTQEPRSLHCSSCQWMYSFSRDRNVHSFQARLCLSLSGILMVSMNNILQVSSRSSLALPRRKLSNSRQVIPLCSSECSKSCSESLTVNEKHAWSVEETHSSQSRCDCNHKLTLMPRHQDWDCVSSAFFLHACPPHFFFPGE